MDMICILRKASWRVGGSVIVFYLMEEKGAKGLRRYD